MRIVEDLIDELRSKYDGSIPFKLICFDEGITVIKTKLPEGLDGLYVATNGFRMILLSVLISQGERRDKAFHELYHHFKSPGTPAHNQSEERKADLFAAICRAPVVRDGDTVSDLVDRYGMGQKLAKMRLAYECNRIGG